MPEPAPPIPTPDPIVGIDLGTTNSLIAYCDDSGPRILTDAGGRPILPSAVRFSPNAATPEAVGEPARTRAVEFPDRTIAGVKRLMGRSLADAAPDRPFLPFQLTEGPRDTARILLPCGHAISPEQVSAIILSRLREIAAEALKAPVRRAVITVPAYFDDAQRQATRHAARIAGLEAVRIINEPTAAALAYGIGLARKVPETIAVYDLGGGTFDISILRIIPDDQTADGDELLGADFFHVLSTAGDTHLGGDDADQLIIRLITDEAQRALGRELRFSPRTRQALKDLAERAKITLSGAQQAHLRIDLDGAPEPFDRTITRAEFESLITPWVERSLEACRRALRDAKLTPDDVDRVVMVGGSTRIPLVRERVAELFRSEPYTALDPDHVVALGAAVQGSMIAGGSAVSSLLLDVVPLSLGIETMGGAVAKLIMRNTTIPARASERFSTSIDNQTSIKLHIIQGEREMVEDCRSLGVFHLSGIPPMPAGIPQLEVEFLVDANGVLSVSAHERRSGKRASLQVIPNHGLTADEVERMERDSLAHARDDMQRHRIVDLIANSRLDLKWIRDLLTRLEPRITPAEREPIAARLDELADLIATAESDWRSVDANAFHAAKQALDEASIRLHEISIAESLRNDSEPA